MPAAPEIKRIFEAIQQYHVRIQHQHPATSQDLYIYLLGMLGRWHLFVSFFVCYAFRLIPIVCCLVTAGVELVCFFMIVLFFNIYSGNSSDSLLQALSQSRVPVQYFLAIITQVALIFIDRIIYLWYVCTCSRLFLVLLEARVVLTLSGVM